MNMVATTTDDLPQDLAVVKTFDRLRDAFPAEAVTVDVAVKADDVRSGATAAAIADLRAQADGSLELLQGTQIEYSEDGTVALLSIPTEGSGNDRNPPRPSMWSATSSFRTRSAGSTARL